VKLIERPVRSIVGTVADAARHWANPDFPSRVRALAAVCERTRYSVPVVAYAFDRLFESITQSAIESAIARELGSLDALDRFVPVAPDARARALPVGRVAVLSSRTTVGVAILPAIFALCAKCDVLVKDREDALVAAFFSTLADELEEFREAATGRAWDGESNARDLNDFDAVVAFGNDATLQRIRASLAPAARWIGFGTKASCGYIGREALTDLSSAQRIAEGAARDLVLYDSEGCLCLHVLFVERGGRIDAAEFAAMLARAVERAGIEFPAGNVAAGTAAPVAAARDAAVFRAAVVQEGTVYSNAAASYLVVVDPPFEEPPFFLARTLGIHTVDSPRMAAAFVERHRLPIEAIAVAGMRPDIAAAALEVGAARIAAFGTLQAPPVRNYHGGRPRIAEFVRWVTDET
jgi:hypothetical protein